MNKVNNYTILVNKNNKCPNNLNFKIINIDSRYDINRKAEEKTYLAFKNLQSEALINGFDIDVESGYRSKELQQEIYDYYLNINGLEYNNNFVAIPGYSEHQTGLAIDVCLKEDDKFLIEHDLPEDFIDFLRDTSHKYGFIIRYPKGKEITTGYGYEPWHLRYVGIDIAEYIYNNNLTLEEYLLENINDNN